MADFTVINGMEVAERPASIDGCFASWREATIPQTIRTSMETGLMRTRRRFTTRARSAQVELTLPSHLYSDFINWIVTRCQGGARPTFIKPPYWREGDDEEIWRITGIPPIDWVDRNAFRTQLTIEQMPGWSL